MKIYTSIQADVFCHTCGSPLFGIANFPEEGPTRLTIIPCNKCQLSETEAAFLRGYTAGKGDADESYPA